MRDPIWAYWQTTGLTPEKFYVENEKTGDVGEIDQRTGNGATSGSNQCVRQVARRATAHTKTFGIGCRVTGGNLSVVQDATKWPYILGRERHRPERRLGYCPGNGVVRGHAGDGY